MQLPDIFLSDAVARAICWTLIHSLWQGILIAALAGLIIYGTRKSVVIRYNLLAADLLLFLLLAVATFGYELRQGANEPGGSPVPGLTVSATRAPDGVIAEARTTHHSGWVQLANDYLNTHASVITWIWLACLSFQLLRFSGGLYQVRRIRQKAMLPPGSLWPGRLSVLARRLGIRRRVRLLESAEVRTPSAIGWWKPSILIPLGLLANLPPDQVETILLHELAHIRRNDYPVNLVLHLTEAVFFFNPGLRWVATLLRREREACCDDMVLAGTSDRNSYLEALVGFAQWMLDEKAGSNRGYALRLGQGKTDLLWRIRRMLNQENKKLQPMEKLILSFGLMTLLSISLISMYPAAPRGGVPVARSVAGASRKDTVVTQTDTIPASSARSDQRPVTIEHLTISGYNADGYLKYHAKAIDKDGNQYEISRQGGEVKEFRLNGRLIPKEEYDRYQTVFEAIETARKNIPKPPAPPVPAEPAPAARVPAAPQHAAPVLVAPVLVAPVHAASAPSPLAPVPSVPGAPLPPSHPIPAERAPTPDDPMVFTNCKNSYAEQILFDLVRDGLARDLTHISFVLNADEMIVDDVRQPATVYQTYRQKYIQSAVDHMIYSQYYTPHGSGAHSECVHLPDVPAPVN